MPRDLGVLCQEPGFKTNKYCLFYHITQGSLQYCGKVQLLSPSRSYEILCTAFSYRLGSFFFRCLPAHCLGPLSSPLPQLQSIPTPPQRLNLNSHQGYSRCRLTQNSQIHRNAFPGGSARHLEPLGTKGQEVDEVRPDASIRRGIICKEFESSNKTN